jgi:nucleoid-associated protein YgaU
MQTMPAKTRTAMTVGAILLGLVVVGAMALYSSRAKAPTADKNGDPYLTQEMGTTPGDETADAAPSATAPADTLPGITAPANTGAAANTGSAMTQPATGGQSAATAAMSSTQVPETYVVAQGETLRDIAQRFYGDPVYSADIETMNSIKDPDKIMAGDTLKLPSPESLHK